MCVCERERGVEIKYWTTLIAFRIALVPLGKGMNPIIFLYLWVNSRANWVLSP